MKKSSILLLVLFIIACSTPRNTGYKPESKTYKKEPNAIHPEFSIHHLNDTLSELNYKIRSKELLYTRPDGINFYSNVLISFRLSSSYDSKEFSDSASVRLVDQNNDGADKFLIGRIQFHARTLKNYYLRVTVSDLNRNTEFTKVVVVQKDNDINKQNFIVQSKLTNAPLFNNVVKTNEEIAILYKEKISVKLFVRYYNRDFALALPPFSETEIKPFHYQPDSTFAIQLVDGKADFMASKRGFYHFQLDTTKRDGLTVFNFSDTYPEVKKVEELIPPLRYITSKDEFNELTSAENKKAAIDKFWLNCTGNADRAKELIRKFYTRMQDANTNFTSYEEGWKTDRGMIFLIQGPPNVIYRDGTRESWIYGEENSVNSVVYLFSKVSNPFTDNDFELERSQIFKQFWYTSVDAWRQGRVYLQNN
jgi:GWxTD domain-containing protein